MCMREPTNRELLYDIRQLLYKLVYGNEAEGIEPISKKSDIDKYASLVLKINLLETEINMIKQRISVPTPYYKPTIFDENYVGKLPSISKEFVSENKSKKDK